jgi:FolB domain-containing protein
MLGTIILKDLKINCIIGVNPEERKRPQYLIVDLELDFDFDEPAKTEELRASVNS